MYLVMLIQWSYLHKKLLIFEDKLWTRVQNLIKVGLIRMSAKYILILSNIMLKQFLELLNVIKHNFKIHQI